MKAFLRILVLMLLPSLAFAGFELRQSTASQEWCFVLIDVSDGTILTGATIANTEIKLVKPGGTTETAKNSGGATEIVGTGRYCATFDATDTDTAGSLTVVIRDGAATSVEKEYVLSVLTDNWYDAKYSTDELDTSLVQVAGIAVVTGTTQTAAHTSTAITLASGQIADDNQFQFWDLEVTSGNCIGQSRRITATDRATDVVTLGTALVVDASGTCTAIDAGLDAVTYTLRPPSGVGQTLLTAASNIGIDWSNISNPTTAVDLSGTDIQLVDTVTTNTNEKGTDSAATAAALATVQSDTDDIQTRIPAALVGGAMDSDVSNVQTNGIPNGSIAAGAINSTSVGTLDATDITAVGSVTGAVGSVTGAVGSVTADVTIAAATETDITNRVLERSGAIICTVDSTNGAPTINSAVCDLTLPRAGSTVTAETNAYIGYRAILTTSGSPPPVVAEAAWVFASTWSGANTELTITLDPALPAAPENGDVFLIRP